MKTKFISAIDDICKAARMLQEALPSVERDEQYTDSEFLGARVPTGLSCVRLAFQVWERQLLAEELRERECVQRAMYQLQLDQQGHTNGATET